MSGRERRKHCRLPLNARVAVSHPAFGTMVVRSRDISNSGLFIEHGEHPYPPLGTVVRLQALDMAVEAPILNARIAREEPGGVGVEFCDDEV